MKNTKLANAVINLVAYLSVEALVYVLSYGLLLWAGVNGRLALVTLFLIWMFR